MKCSVYLLKVIKIWITDQRPKGAIQTDERCMVYNCKIINGLTNKKKYKEPMMLQENIPD